MLFVLFLFFFCTFSGFNVLESVRWWLETGVSQDFKVKAAQVILKVYYGDPETGQRRQIC